VSLPAGAIRAAALFATTFGEKPGILASAPGRVNLVGEHTDYNGGEVLPIAIEQRTWVAARANGGATVRAVSATQSDAGEFPVSGAVRAGRWWDYPAGVAMQFAHEGVTIAGTDLAIASDLPAGAGLASSASLEIACGLALARAAGHDLSHRDLAVRARRAEEEFVGVAVGIMDQLVSALAVEAHALRIWCDTAETDQVPFTGAVLVFDTRVARQLRGAAFNERRAECERALAALRVVHPGLRALAAATPEEIGAAGLPAPLDRRARHVARETRRVARVAAALGRGEALPGDELLASHESLRRDFECSCAELDWFVDRVMREPGVTGARLTGAGWGGCAIAAGDRPSLEQAATAVSREYDARFGRTSRWWIARASAGASVGVTSPTQ
jgi:galactokinase